VEFKASELNRATSAFVAPLESSPSTESVLVSLDKDPSALVPSVVLPVSVVLPSELVLPVSAELPPSAVHSVHSPSAVPPLLAVVPLPQTLSPVTISQELAVSADSRLLLTVLAPDSPAAEVPLADAAAVETDTAAPASVTSTATTVEATVPASLPAATAADLAASHHTVATAARAVVATVEAAAACPSADQATTSGDYYFLQYLGDGLRHDSPAL